MTTDQQLAPWRAKLRPIMSSKAFHLSMIYLVLFDLVLVVVDLIISLYSSCVPDEEGHCTSQLANSSGLETGQSFLYWLSVSILCIFFLEIVVSVAVFGKKHLMSPIAAFDALIIVSALVTELYFHFSGLEQSGSNTVVILRILKLVRGMHAVAHAAAYQARERVHHLEQLNAQIAERSETLNNALSVAKDKMEALFESVVLPEFHAKDTVEMRARIVEVYEQLKRVVAMSEAGLEDEVEALIAREDGGRQTSDSSCTVVGGDGDTESETESITKKEFHLA
ncbi:hypothetical protein BC830DRAFT_1168487 [Chytriomyces sp. MP71]|nr:hypothetical protein BC830DRAFT_1168487 [Chytriomyces sp. MP71]